MGKVSQMRGQLIDQFSLPCFFWFYCLFKPPTQLCGLPVYTSSFQSIARNLGLILYSLFSLNPRSHLSAVHVTFISQTYHHSIQFSQHLLPPSYFKYHHLSIFWITAIASKWIFPLPLLTMNNSFSTKKLLVMTQSCYDKETPKYSICISLSCNTSGVSSPRLEHQLCVLNI